MSWECRLAGGRLERTLNGLEATLAVQAAHLLLRLGSLSFRSKFRIVRLKVSAMSACRPSSPAQVEAARLRKPRAGTRPDFLLPYLQLGRPPGCKKEEEAAAAAASGGSSAAPPRSLPDRWASGEKQELPRSIIDLVIGLSVALQLRCSVADA